MKEIKSNEMFKNMKINILFNEKISKNNKAKLDFWIEKHIMRMEVDGNVK